MVKEGVKNSMFPFICETNRKHGWKTQTRVLCRLSDWAILHLVSVYVVLHFLERKKYTSAGEIWHPRETLTRWSFFLSERLNAITLVSSLYGGNFHRPSSIWFAYLLRSILPESNERLLILWRRRSLWSIFDVHSSSRKITVKVVLGLVWGCCG